MGAEYCGWTQLCAAQHKVTVLQVSIMCELFRLWCLKWCRFCWLTLLYLMSGIPFAHCVALNVNFRYRWWPFNDLLAQPSFKLGHGIDCLTPSSAEVKERVELYLYSSSGPVVHICALISLYQMNTNKCTHILFTTLLTLYITPTCFNSWRAIFREYNWYILAAWDNKISHQL
jgi:hypothetical protein